MLRQLAARDRVHLSLVHYLHPCLCARCALCLPAVSPLVVYNDEVDIARVLQLLDAGEVSHVILSPGPGAPDVPADIGAQLGRQAGRQLEAAPKGIVQCHHEGGLPLAHSLTHAHHHHHPTHDCAACRLPRCVP